MDINITGIKDDKNKSILTIIIIIVFEFIIAYIISTSQKTDFLFTHLMYLPVICAAMIFDYKIGLFCGLIGSLLIEVLLPPQPYLSFYKQLYNGIIRTIFFVFAGLLVGLYKNATANSHSPIMDESIPQIDSFTKIPTWSAFLVETRNLILKKEIINFRFILLEISNQNELLATFGMDFIYEINREMVKKIRHFYHGCKLYLIRLNTIGIILPDSMKNQGDLINLLEKPIPVHGIPAYCEVSMGEATYPEGGYSPGELLKNAALALNSAKLSHKPFQSYHPRLVNLEIPLLLGQFQKAISNREVDFHYQPIVDGEGKVCSLEALVRWNHPIKGYIPPNEFIADLEFTRVANYLTYYSMDINLQRTIQLIQQGFDIKISLNISITNLFQTDFFDKVRKTIEKYQFPPDHLILEVTERGFLTNDKDCQTNLIALNKYGVNISIDDFGVGFTSIGNFRHLGVNAIKIDRSFIENIHQNKANQVIVKSLTTIAKSSGVMVIAEGIEIEKEKKKVLALGVDRLQGYLISKPLDFPSIQHWLEETCELDQSHHV